MAVHIRLQRQGAKKKPEYLVVAMDSAKKRDGEYLARLGHYFPREKDASKKIQVDLPAVQAWIAKGAQPTQTVGQLLKTLSK
jgi:small subunit ribosomal protein S16